MTTTAGYALTGSVFALAALVNWWAVARAHRTATVIAKPVTLLALIGLAVVGGAGDHTTGRWLLLGLVLCLAGDVFLLGDSDPAFLGGLTSFLLGHLAYVAAFVTLDRPTPVWVVAGVLALAAAVVIIRRVPPAAYHEGGPVLAAAVIAYILVIGAMVLTAWLTGQWLIGLGATTFMVSDSILSLNKFVAHQRHSNLAVMVTYHLGQLLIVLGVLTAT